ncbi:unnamed protein product [Notodromas monacha]|uniref:Uncharacterized protein n=1 Tax=Notodromas monacha TaxID=399045 RepID=A0A7R9G7W6_9CRUS|nr:unnamed protein product [Notodromas monacha]CAG0912501.1 unnamed protein product [Notodromas monacha]
MTTDPPRFPHLQDLSRDPTPALSDDDIDPSPHGTLSEVSSRDSDADEKAKKHDASAQQAGRIVQRISALEKLQRRQGQSCPRQQGSSLGPGLSAVPRRHSGLKDDDEQCSCPGFCVPCARNRISVLRVKRGSEDLQGSKHKKLNQVLLIDKTLGLTAALHPMARTCGGSATTALPSLLPGAIRRNKQDPPVGLSAVPVAAAAAPTCAVTRGHRTRSEPVSVLPRAAPAFLRNPLPPPQEQEDDGRGGTSDEEYEQVLDILDSSIRSDCGPWRSLRDKSVRRSAILRRMNAVTLSSSSSSAAASSSTTHSLSHVRASSSAASSTPPSPACCSPSSSTVAKSRDTPRTVPRILLPPIADRSSPFYAHYKPC